MNKMQMAHEYMLETIKFSGYRRMHMMQGVVDAWKYADAMQAEADERNKAEAEQKRKEVREILNDANTFIEREGQHFDDVEWQPGWSQAPDGYNYWVATADHSGKISGGWFYDVKPVIGESDGVSIYYSNSTNAILTESFNYQGDWKESLRERPKSLCEVDWRVAPTWAKYWAVREDSDTALWCINKPTVTGDCFLSHGGCSPAPSFGFTGNHLVERPQ